MQPTAHRDHPEKGARSPFSSRATLALTSSPLSACESANAYNR
jgi:hypothetical protein